MTKKEENNIELFESLLKLNIKYAIEDSNTNMRMIYNTSFLLLFFFVLLLLFVLIIMYHLLLFYPIVSVRS